MPRVLKERDALVRHVKEDHGRPKDRAVPDHVHVKDMTDRDQHENEHLPAEAPERYLAGQRPVADGTEHSRHLIDHNEYEQGVDQPVTPAEEPSEPASKAGKYKLNHVLKFFHRFTNSPSGCKMCLLIKKSSGILSRFPEGFHLSLLWLNCHSFVVLYYFSFGLY